MTGHITSRELVVVLRRELKARALQQQVTSAAGADVSALGGVLMTENIALTPLFGDSEDHLRTQAATLASQGKQGIPDLSVFYRVAAPDERLDDLAAKLNQTDGVETAYVKAAAQRADVGWLPHRVDHKEPPAVTPSFADRQDYLGRAPGGMGVDYAHTVPGGHGKGVNIVDIGRGWNFNHEDLRANQGGIMSGRGSDAYDIKEHGTAILGIFSGDRNPYGIKGISPKSRVRGSSPSSPFGVPLTPDSVTALPYSTSEAIYQASNGLSAGDIMLVSMQRPGPRSNGGENSFGCLPLEFWLDDFYAIKYATLVKGIIVVEAAGNGGQNLDDPLYANTAQLSFDPSGWKPLSAGATGSGAVIVGAGMPPRNNSHDRDRHPETGDLYTDRGRCFYSNYGSRVDAQGWGWEVTTTGYGDLQGGYNPNRWYTDQFSGTSAAAAMVTGALACIQGILRAHDKPVLTPAQAIDLLRTTGSPQKDARGFTFAQDMTGTGYPQEHPPRPSSENIGNRPHLRPMIEKVLAEKTKFLFRTGTALHETPQDFVFTMADVTKDKHPDLVAIGQRHTPSGKTEVHVLSRLANNYQQFVSQIPTALPETGPEFHFMMADWNGDGHQDLVAVKTENTPSGCAEVHILSGASNYQTYLLHAETALIHPGQDFQFAMGQWDREGRPDLFAIRKNNTGTGQVEVHVLTGRSEFKEFALHGETPLPHNQGNFTFAIADWLREKGRPDLFAIKKHHTGTGTTEVHVLSGASNFEQFILHSETVLPETGDNFDFTVVDWDLSGRADLVGIKKFGTGSRTTELHVVDIPPKQ